MHPIRYPNQKHSMKNGMLHVESVNEEPSLTQQHSKDEADINTIVKKYETTGQFQCAIKQGGQYADFSQITDFKEMCETVVYARDAFMTLPAQVRAKFQNDPGNLLDFLQDPKNYDEGVSLGLLSKREQTPTLNSQSQNNDDPNDDKHFSEITITKKRAPKPS